MTHMTASRQAPASPAQANFRFLMPIRTAPSLERVNLGLLLLPAARGARVAKSSGGGSSSSTSGGAAALETYTRTVVAAYTQRLGGDAAGACRTWPAPCTPRSECWAPPRGRRWRNVALVGDCTRVGTYFTGVDARVAVACDALAAFPSL
ncbi:hypothetical protein JKP88DRAFT_283941 [Tribonema minus]|uniref:Uncharacterized protein n=1 Tax=Tribonema minus TaxID=303371 RepID=A0A836C847_9STRA|nr:hypothetical protein JKP88DRAFT_283941 [Tribonema minus]